MEIDVDSLIVNSIPPERMIIAKLLLDKKLGLLKSYQTMSPHVVNGALQFFKEAGIIVSEEYLNLNTLQFSIPKLTFFISPKRNSCFWELFHAYPVEVIHTKTGAIRHLRAKGEDTENARMCKRLYDSIVKDDKRKHLVILKCLEAELWERERGKNMPFMLELINYIKKRSWENYIHWIDKSLDRNPANNLLGPRVGYGEQEYT